eukprot:6172158-Pleurochrysis_carterae.AAC.2
MFVTCAASRAALFVRVRCAASSSRAARWTTWRSWPCASSPATSRWRKRRLARRSKQSYPGPSCSATPGISAVALSIPAVALSIRAA